MSLFNKYESYTPAGNSLGRDADRVIRPLFDKWFKMGHSSREIEAIILQSLTTYVGGQRIVRAFEVRRQEREENR